MDKREIVTLPLEAVRRIYRERMVEDFPKDELKPLKMIEKGLERGEYICYGCADGDDIWAYAFFVKRGGRVLLDYYAVRKDLRDRGVGSRFLRGLIEGPMSQTDCVLVEVDAPESAPDAAERERRVSRMRFYLRNGLWETGARARVFGVDFQILAFPGSRLRGARSAAGVYAALYRAILPPDRYAQWVRVWPEPSKTAD